MCFNGTDPSEVSDLTLCLPHFKTRPTAFPLDEPVGGPESCEAQRLSSGNRLCFLLKTAVSWFDAPDANTALAYVSLGTAVAFHCIRAILNN